MHDGSILSVLLHCGLLSTAYDDVLHHYITFYPAIQHHLHYYLLCLVTLMLTQVTNA